jgi:hypothetical protein
VKFATKLKDFTYLSWNLYGGYPWDVKFQILVFGSQYSYQKPSDVFWVRICLTKLKVFTFLRWNLYGRHPKDFKFQNSEYRGHQVGPKDSGSQNVSFLAFKGEAVGVAKMYANATATARDRRNFLYCSNRVFRHKKY